MLDQLAYEPSMAEAWVYMLRCADGSLYTGWTVDMQRRLARHQAGTASRYTASRLPVELAWVRQMPDRHAAQREETVIKKLARGEKLALVAAGVSDHPKGVGPKHRCALESSDRGRAPGIADGG
jgi:predicted GIY-YIG superfamily endonuclease